MCFPGDMRFHDFLYTAKAGQGVFREPTNLEIEDKPLRSRYIFVPSILAAILPNRNGCSRAGSRGEI